MWRRCCDGSEPPAPTLQIAGAEKQRRNALIAHKTWLFASRMSRSHDMPMRVEVTAFATLVEQDAVIIRASHGNLH